MLRFSDCSWKSHRRLCQTEC